MLHRFSFDALDTAVTVAVFDKAFLPPASEIALAMASAIDRSVNHSNPASEIHAFDSANGQRIVVSSLLRITLERAIRNAEITQGILNPLRLEKSTLPQGPWKNITIESDEVSIPAGYKIETRQAARAGLAEDIAHRISTQISIPVMVTVGYVTAFAGPEAPKGGWKFNTDAQNHLYDVVMVPNNEAISVSLADDEEDKLRLPWRSVAVQARSALFADALARAAQIDPHWTIPKIKEYGLTARLIDHDGRARVFGNWSAVSQSAVNKLLDHTDQFAAIVSPDTTPAA